jgi:hypothetical protein
LNNLREIAERIDLAVARELTRAEQLAEQGFYSEAGLRLGRAIEAGLYSIARELNIDLTNRTITTLANLTGSLRGAEINIMRKRTLDEVRLLSNVAKTLSDSIARLAQDEVLRGGALSEHPRPNEQLFRELVQKVADTNVRRRLEASKDLLRTIQEHRNAAAHAALDGSERELDEVDYEDLVEETDLFLASLLDCIISERARRIWGAAANT